MTQDCQLERDHPVDEGMLCGFVQYPIAALVLACRRGIFDEELAVTAITSGLATKTCDDIFDPV